MELQAKRISLLIVATGKYTQFLEGLLDSADKFFLKDCEVKFHVFTDKTVETAMSLRKKPYARQLEIFQVEHKPFPYPTLHRYHFFRRKIWDIEPPDYFFYVDVDCLFKAPVTSEILSEITAVQHCGYVGERGTYETRPESTSYVSQNEGSQYFGGGFWGFSAVEFYKFIGEAVRMIDADEKNGIIPIWHDESTLNRYLINNPPTKILSPSYHYPENHQHIYNKWRKKGLSFEPIILLLDKNHKEVRA